MSSTFLLIFIALLIMAVFWRITLIAILAFLLTMFLTGINGVVGHLGPANPDSISVPTPDPGKDPLFEPPR